MRKLFCDICTKQINYPPVDPLHKKLNESYYKIDMDLIPSIEVPGHIDACLDCGKKVLDLIRSIKPKLEKVE